MGIELSSKAKRVLRIPTVDYSTSRPKTISAQTGDVNSRLFVVELFDDEGNIDLAKYTSATLNITYTDGDVKYTSAEIDNENHLIICKMPAVDAAGKYACDIVLVGEDEDNNPLCLTSQSFVVTVLKSLKNDNAVVADDNYPILVQLIHTVQEFVRAEQARTALEEQRAAAEEERRAAEEERNRKDYIRDSVVNGFQEQINNLGISFLGISGEISIKEFYWDGKVYSFVLPDMHEDDAVFLYPHGVNDKIAIDECNIYASADHNIITLVCIGAPPTEEIVLNYFIARGREK